MLREEVLKEWGNLRNDLLNVRSLVKESFLEDSLPSFPVGIESCRNNLDFWKNKLWDKIHQNRDKIVKIESTGEISSYLFLLCLSRIDMFKELVEGWKREKYDNDRVQKTIDSLKNEVNFNVQPIMSRNYGESDLQYSRREIQRLENVLSKWRNMINSFDI